MRFAKRQSNPIFIEDEVHHWKPRKPLFVKLLSITGLALGLVTLVLLIVN
ncbi:MAG: hypothetical protein WEB57_09140 [Pseudohongiellaceae bacterium]